MGTLLTIYDQLKDIVATGKDIGKQVYDLSGKYKHSSIAMKAAEGTLQFPIIVSDSIDIETAQMVTKALERNYATFAQTVFSMSPTMTYNQDMTAADYLRQFHQNQPKMADLIFKEAAEHYNVFFDENVAFMGAVYETATRRLVADNKEQLIDLMESLRSDILNNKVIPRDTTIYNFKNQNLNAKYNSIVKEADDNLSERKFQYTKEKDAKDFDYRQSKDANDFDYKKYQDSLRTRSIDLSQNMLKDNDVKKANELIATTLHVRVRLVNKNEQDVGIVDFIVGIKGIMHPVKSSEMIVNMVSACRNNDKIFNFLRWTTGEISFFKDFLFNIEGVKKDIYDQSKGASPWWIALKRRKELATYSKGKGKGSVLPNATIVISAEEAAFIESEYGYDLHNKIFISKIMNQYFLLGFVIVDSASQIVHFLFDGDSDFQSVTFSALERAGSNDERKFKEMLKAINRV